MPTNRVDDKPPLEQLKDLLYSSKGAVLIVLDNFETVYDPSPGMHRALLHVCLFIEAISIQERLMTC